MQVSWQAGLGGGGGATANALRDDSVTSLLSARPALRQPPLHASTRVRSAGRRWPPTPRATAA